MTLASERVRPTPVAGAVGGVAAAAWAVLATGAVGHPSHDHLLGGHDAPGLADIAGFFGAWLLMVLAMMLPAEIPWLAAARPGTGGRSWSATARLVAATCAVWTLFGAVALAGDAALHRLVHSWPWLAGHESLIAAAVLVTAGAFQLSVLGRRMHHAALAPLSPTRHAVACLGSCGPLMLVMFAVGAGSLVWMAALTAAMTLERTSRLGPRLVPLTGLALVAAGLLVA